MAKSSINAGSTTRAAVVALARPAYLPDTVADVLRAMAQDDRLEQARMKLTRQTIGDAFRATLSDSADKIAAGEATADDIAKLRIDALAMELSAHRAALVERQSSLRCSQRENYKALRLLAHEAVRKLREHREAEELSEAKILALRFEPSTALRAIVSTEAWLNDQTQHEQARIESQPLSLTFRVLLPNALRQ